MNIARLSILVGIVAVLAPVTFALPPQQLQQEDGSMPWLTYHDATYRFSIRYPSTYMILEESVPYENSMPQLIHRLRFQDKDILGASTAALEPPQFTLEVFKNPSGLTLQNWLEQNRMLPPNSEEQVASIAGISGLQVMRRELIAPGRFAFVAHDGHVYRMTLIGRYSDEMLKSFQFIN